MLSYVAALLTYGSVTLLGCITVGYLIVRRRPVIALILASPFTLWNFVAAQSGFLTAFFIGAALLALERRPILAGCFLGCLTFKPQFGLLFPVALVAAKQWRAIASAAAAALILAGISVAIFGAAPWEAFPRELVAQAKLNLVIGPGLGADPTPWGNMETIYGQLRFLHGTPALAWLAQGITTLSLCIIVWRIWRSPVRYSLKAATLSVGALLATPYAFAYDFAAIVIPVAYLAKDQIDCGLLRGEQTVLLALFVAALSVIAALGRGPATILILLVLLWLILHRLTMPCQQPQP
jgi:hypothetical protein